MTSWVSEEPILLITALLFLLVIRRSILLARGVPYSTNRLIVQGLLYVILFAFTIAFDVSVLPVWTFALDGAILAAGAVVAAVHVRRGTVFTQREDGVWMYRLGILLPAIYLALWAVRVAVEIVVLPDAFGTTGPLPALDNLQQFALAGVDALFSFSAGLLLGRSFGVYRAYEDRPRGPPTVPPSAPPLAT
jgi:hypothetical protein